MILNTLEYTNFALKSLVDKKPVDKFVFYNALNGITEFLNSDLNEKELYLVNENIDVLRGVSNILKINYEGGSCIQEIIEVNYSDFTKLISHLYAIQ